ncbi:hypothetical protein ZWY2020_060119, partial [Hordeum vulgare]
WMRAGGARGRRQPFHVALTATDAPYSRWQCRVMYFWYKRMQARPEGYIVLNRPWAFVQWLQQAKIEEEYILMAEPDHIFVKPLPNLAFDNDPAAFPFFYITPSEYEKIIRKYYPEERVLSRIFRLCLKIAPMDECITTNEEDQETDKAFGWVLEMYAYAVASALHGVQHILRKDFMIQGVLTYGKIGEWRFDKRSYQDRPP